MPTARGIEVQRALAPGRSSREDEEGHEGDLVLWLAEKRCISREREAGERIKAERQEGAGKPGTLGVRESWNIGRV